MAAPDSTASGPFVSTNWLADHLTDPDVQIVDGSWYLPTQGRDAAREFMEGHIPGAVFFDIDAIADRSTDLPHMLLDPESFGEACGALGLASDNTLVVYDGAGLFSAARVRWMLRHFGAERVAILEGGLPKWKQEGRPLAAGADAAKAAVFSAQVLNDDAVDLAAVREVLATGSAQVVDARPAARFRGEAPEPRPGVRPGHMPGSSNLPFSEIVEDGRLKSPEMLKQAFESAGIDLDRPVITSCGSGVSAALLVLGLETMGKTDSRLYDGSWAEYGSRDDLPVATGP